VDRRIERAEPVDLLGHRPGLIEVGEVSDNSGRAPVDERAEGGEPIDAAGVHDYCVTVAEQRRSGGSAQAVRGAGD
jgi:hypothetical protein